MNRSTGEFWDNIAKLKAALDSCDAVIIGAGSGLSTAAGYDYGGARFEKNFSDFRKKFGMTDMYSGGFYPFPTPEIQWAWWSRHIWINRYAPAPKPVYNDLLALIKGKDYFVITTNVDHCFRRAGFDKSRLFYTQGDYGLFQCTLPCHHATYANATAIRAMVEDQGFIIEPDGSLTIPEGGVKMEVRSELIPHCPKCGRPMDVNLRCDDTFVEDAGWHAAAGRYGDFLARHGIGQKGFFTGDSRGEVDTSYQGKLLLLELGVGMNTPGIIKYPFWWYTKENKNVTYACVSRSGAYAPDEIGAQSVCVNGDIAELVQRLIPCSQTVVQ